VLLGDNWLIERSNKQACELIDRRLAGIDAHIGKLNQENEAILKALEWTENITKVKRLLLHSILHASVKLDGIFF